MKIISTTKAPQAIGPYSQAIVHNGLLFASGQIPLVPETMTLIGDDVESQTRQVLQNMLGVLEEVGLNYSNIIKTSIFIKDMNHFQSINKIYEEVLSPYKPARSTVEVSRLPKDVLIEIEFIAAL